MKKKLCFLMMAVFFLGMTACSDDDDDKKEAVAGTAEPDGTGKSTPPW